MKETSFLFRELKEAKQFYFFLLGKLQTDQLTMSNQTITVQSDTTVSPVELVELIYPFVLEHYGTKISHFILEKQFYFEKEERDQIIPYIVTLSATPKFVHSQFQYSLYERLVQFLYEESNELISFDKMYQQLFLQDHNWVELVGFGIEEWKQELIYQEKMNELRGQLDIYANVHDKVIVVLDHQQEPVVMDKHARLISNDVLLESKYRFTQETEDMLKHAEVLRKLLLINPEKIIVYTDKNQTHNLYAIMNVFQEKVEIRSLGKFPFLHVKK
uniref:sporulation protein YtxC n=1 Tax=uncultured Allobacillus sp. TaxID=1638025 RepID=UPI002594871B|nr:sporulation protein YtxC [uncultured Allobacillus sp.]